MLVQELNIVYIYLLVTCVSRSEYSVYLLVSYMRVHELNKVYIYLLVTCVSRS